MCFRKCNSYFSVNDFNKCITYNTLCIAYKNFVFCLNFLSIFAFARFCFFDTLL